MKNDDLIKKIISLFSTKGIVFSTSFSPNEPKGFYYTVGDVRNVVTDYIAWTYTFPQDQHHFHLVKIMHVISHTKNEWTFSVKTTGSRVMTISMIPLDYYIKKTQSTFHNDDYARWQNSMHEYKLDKFFDKKTRLAKSLEKETNKNQFPDDSIKNEKEKTTISSQDKLYYCSQEPAKIGMVIRNRLIVAENDEQYQRIKKIAYALLSEYIGDKKIIQFRDQDNSISFKTERIVPSMPDSRPRVLLLFSNPHPHSIHQGMFLSPAKNKKTHSFWKFMQQAGWFHIPNDNYAPMYLAELFTYSRHESEFNLFFKCFYEFPTQMPKELKEIFGNDRFEKLTEDALHDLKGYVIRKRIKFILVFNGDIFQLLTGENTNGYTYRLNNGELIKSEFIGNNPHAFQPCPTFLTYPTGWHFHKDMKQLRHNSLVQIKEEIKGSSLY